MPCIAARWLYPILCGSMVGGCWAGEPIRTEPIQTDRPDFVESSDVVGRDRFQIETSLAFDHDHDQGVRSTLRYFPTLLRVGVSDTLELRLETDGTIHQHTRDDATGIDEVQFGRADLSLGLKWHMRDGDDAQGLPSIGWLLHVDADTGSAEFRGQGWRPSLRMVAEWDLPDDYSVGVMPGFYQERNADDKGYVGGILAVVVGKSLNDHWRVFGELSGQQLTAVRNGGNVVTADVGVAYLLSREVQIDCAFAKGMTSQAPDRSWTFGVSVRF